MSVLSDALPPSAASAASFRASGTDSLVGGSVRSDTTQPRRGGAQAVLLRQCQANGRQSQGPRWEAEVARGVACGQGRSESLPSRGLRNAARISMKSAGSRLSDLVATGGTCITEDDVNEAEERTLQKRLEQKQEALAVEAAKAADRAKKMAVKRAKIKQTQLRHELRIHEAQAKKSALDTQADQDKEALRDIVSRRHQAQQLLAEREPHDDSLECVLRWALPEAWTGAGAVGEQMRDDDMVVKLMRKGGGKILGDDEVRRLMAKGDSKRHDENTVLNLMGSEGGSLRDDDAVLGLLQGGDDKLADDGTVRRLMSKEGDTLRDDAAVLGLMQRGDNKLGDDGTVLRLMGKQNGQRRNDDTGHGGQRQDDDTVLALMRGEAGGPEVHQLRKSANVQQLMVKANLEEDIRSDAIALGLLPRDSQQLGTKLMMSRANAARDDESFRLILDSSTTRDEAVLNADALRFILGGASDPVTRLAHLARTRPKAGRSREQAEVLKAEAEAVRDLQVLNGLLEKTDLDVDIQAWKDVGAIHMLMNDLSGPDQERRRRVNKLRAEDEAAQALLGRPPPPPPSLSSQLRPSGTWAANGAQAGQTLLGQPPQGNLLQPPSLNIQVRPPTGSGALQRLIGRPASPEIVNRDTEHIQHMMSPRGSKIMQPVATGHQDCNIIEQLMSPRGSAKASVQHALAGNAPPGATMRNVFNQTGGAAGSNLAQAGLIGMKHNSSDAAVARGLMSDRGSGPPPLITEAQTMRDVDTLQFLLQ